MAGAQIQTAVTAFQSKIGYNGISLSNRDNDSAPTILAGSIVEISNAYFVFGSNETITGWSGITTGNTAYVALTPAGTAGSQTVTAGWVATAPTYIAANGGWYLSAASTIRYVASAIKHGASSYGFKQKLMGENVTTTAPTLIATLTSGTSTATAYYGTDFIVYEQCMVFGEFAGLSNNTADSQLIIQAKINGTYTDVIQGFLTYGVNSIAITDNANKASYHISLSPGTYRLCIFLLGTLALTGSVYRAGRLTDVTQ